MNICRSQTMTRRQATLALTATTVLTVAPTPATSDASRVRGCVLDSAAFQSLRNDLTMSFGGTGRLITSTGDATLDRALGRALVRMAEVFGERPGFGFVDDRGGANAYASPETQVQGTRGTVLFGQTLFADLLSRYDDQGVAVLAVAAHEFGHVAQFSSGVDHQLLSGQPTVRRVELHADFLSGYFLAVRQRQAPDLSIWSAGHTLYSIGDYAFNNRNHHGTPEQRVVAAEAGYARGRDGASFASAFSNGVEYVLDRY